MTTAQVALGYDCSTDSIWKARKRNPLDFQENKHFISVTDKMSVSGNLQRKQLFWTQRGIVRLGFFLKSSNARLFRNWAEDLIIHTLEQPKERKVQLYDHELPLFDILNSWLVKGDIVAVARELGVTPGSVSRVKRGVFRSRRIMRALLDRCRHNRNFQKTDGYPRQMVQLEFNFFAPPKTVQL